MFEQNENNLDRGIRLLLGGIALILGLFFFVGTLKIIFVVLGVIGIFTGLTGFCLLYKIFGISTKK